MGSTRGSAASSLALCLWAIAGIGFFLAILMTLRMGVEVNKVLPPEKRIALIEYRFHVQQIWQLHDDFFPKSRTATLTRWLIAFSAALVAAGLVAQNNK
jgi:hypothetical protein